MKSAQRVATLVLGVLVLSVRVWGADDPFVGTWKLSLAQSRYNPGPSPKSQTITFMRDGDSEIVTIDQVDAEGTRTHYGYTAKSDDKDYAVTGSPLYDTVTLKRIDDHTRDVTLKKGGQVVLTSKDVVLVNGKVWTSRTIGTDARGISFKHSIIHEKD
jgi:hypothetical protein